MGLRNLVLFGANAHARTVLNSVPYWDRVLFIADNNAALHGTLFGNTPVLPPAAIGRATYDQVRICSAAKDPIRRQLLAMGVPAAKILDDPLEPPADLEYLRGLKDRHRGRRAFVIGNGPSLRIEDLTRLHESGDVALAFNKIYLAFDQTPFRPTYYMVEDPLVAENNTRAINALSGFPKLFPERLRTFFHGGVDTHFFTMAWDIRFPSPPGFNPDPAAMCWGSTVVYPALQWAVYLGCDPIYLIGVDFSFIEPAVKEMDGKVLVAEGERNHFHPDYRPVGERWYVPNLHHQQISFEVARAYADAHGVRIVNATRTSRLDVFPRADFDGLFR
jgi:hypothetical protein